MPSSALSSTPPLPMAPLTCSTLGLNWGQVPPCPAAQPSPRQQKRGHDGTGRDGTRRDTTPHHTTPTCWCLPSSPPTTPGRGSLASSLQMCSTWAHHHSCGCLRGPVPALTSPALPPHNVSHFTAKPVQSCWARRQCQGRWCCPSNSAPYKSDC